MPFGLTPVDQNFNAMTGPSGLKLVTLLQSDTIAYGLGDLVSITGAMDSSGSPVARSPWGLPFAFNATDRLAVLVALAPNLPASAAPFSVPAVKAAPYSVWALPVLAREFEIMGDGTAPSRASEKLQNGGVLPSLPRDAIATGTLFADLAQAAPAGGFSGLALVGSSIRSTPTSSMVRILDLAPGQPMAANALWRVQLIRKS
jgi:hypothetical protein